MKPRRPAPAGGVLPAELAAGPASDRVEDVAAWRAAGRAWSVAAGLSWNGWTRLLTPEVRDRVSARRRLERLGRP